MPKIVVDELPVVRDTGPNPEPLGDLGPYEGRPISKHAGLSRLGANLETLLPGAASSARHWHERSDEIVIVLSGELSLIENEGIARLKAGDIATFAAGNANGHCLKNETDTPAQFLVVGSKDAQDVCHYPDHGYIRLPDGTLKLEGQHGAEAQD